MRFSIFTVVAAVLAFAPSTIANLAPRATPDFYLVATSNDPTYDAKVVRGDAAGVTLSLNDGNPPKFYLDNGLLGVDYGGTDYFPLMAYVNFETTGAGPCTTSGELRLVQGPIYRCARNLSFALWSNNQNSQLGARIVFNGVDGFYACSGGKISFSPTALAGCSAVTLWTVPAAQ